MTLRSSTPRRPWALGLTLALALPAAALAAPGATAVAGGPPPSLPALFERALEHDADLARRRYALRATEQEVDKARARLKPQVSASASRLLQHSDNYYTDNPDYDPGGERVDPDNAARFAGDTRDSVWEVSLEQPLFSLERWRGLGRADRRVDTSRLELARGERDLALALGEAYVTARIAAHKLGTLEARQASLALQVRQTQRAFELGVGDRLDVLEASSRLDQDRVETLRARNDLDDAVDTLGRFTGQRPEFAHRALQALPAVTPDIENTDESAWLARLDHNLDVRSARAERALAESETRVRRGAYAPEVSLDLSYRDRASNDPFREGDDATARLQMSMPLYRGGYTRANVRQGELRTRAAEQGMTHRRRLAAEEVRRRLRALDVGLESLQALRQSSDSSALFLDAAQRGEQLGLRDLVDVLDARTELYDQRIRFAETLGRYAQDLLALEAAVGDLDTEDLARVTELLAGLDAAAEGA